MSLQSSTRTVYRLTHVRAYQTCVCTQLETEARIPIGKLGEGNSASILKGNRMGDQLMCLFMDPDRNVEFPFVFLFLYRHVDACKTATHNIKSPSPSPSRMPVCTTRKSTETLVLLSEAVTARTLKSAPHIDAVTNNSNMSAESTV